MMNKEEKKFDVIILGGGPAGLSAGLYAARGAVSVGIIDISMFGGQPSNYLEIENYPGIPVVKGYELSENFESHADLFGVEKFPMQEIESIDLSSIPKVIETAEYSFKAKSVIIAVGAKPKKLGVKGEEEYVGRGVSYCAVCDAAFYKDKVVTVVGGGNAAVEEAMYLTKFASQVYLVHRRDKLRADKIICDRAMENPKIKFIWDSKIEEIQGEDTVNSVIIKNVKTDEIMTLKTDGVFPYIGFSPNTELLNGQLKFDENGFILTDNSMLTSENGVFAAGDVRNTPLRQVVTAVADGAIAAVSAVKYVETLEYETEHVKSL